ncbi:MAG: cation-translocating P-type ATPase [Anaerolineales bacterium]|nr:cation-translocating P-type ATPase [Anaerolineales bacterium]
MEDIPSSDPPLEASINGEDIWHVLEATEIVQALQTSPKQGLSEEEASRRLEQFGPNELEEAEKPSLFRLIFEQFNNFIVIVLIIAALVAAILGDYIEATAILAIVVLNALLGVVQERRAEEALAALQRLAAPDALVLREGHRQIYPARALVPGDIVFLEAGNFIPADLRLIETVNLRIEEAALTGESVPVTKDAHLVLTQDMALGDRRNTAFSGTVVSYGRGSGVVVSTGMRTQIGMIAAMLQAVYEEPTPLQRKLDQLGKALGLAALVVCALVFGVGWLRGIAPLEMFLVAVSLAVAAVPEGLAAVVTITLALGMREMITRHALIRRLSSVETLGSTTVICSDKTGTLTQNQMTVTRMWVDGTTFEITGKGFDQTGEFKVDGGMVDLRDYPASTTVLWVATLANDAQIEAGPTKDGEKESRVIGDPTEAALLVAAAKAGAFRDKLEEAYPRIDEIPFDSSRKRMTTVHKIVDPAPDDASPFYDSELREWEIAAIKGAPDVVVDLCTQFQKMDDTTAPLTDEIREGIYEANARMARSALRVIAVAFRVDPDVPDDATPEKVERDLIFVGLMGMIDPPRPQAKPAIEKARRAGIRTLMITGDFPDTAEEIAEEIALLRPGHGVLTGSQLDTMDDAALKEMVATTDVFARVSPEHKVRIINALKSHGEIVAMTGDGVNDAPALKRADIGVAMGVTGTDVAKEAADMVLTDDNYASIVDAVEQGRVIYSNIRKFVFYLISCNLAEIAVIFTAILAGLPSPLTPIQLLWLNLITDGAPALALGMEKGDPDIMAQPPRPPDEPVINRPMRTRIGIQTLAIAGVTLAAYWMGIKLFPGIPEEAKTMAFVTLSFSELLRAFTARSERYPLHKIGFFSNKWMFYAVTSSLLLLLAVIYVPFLQPIFNTVPLGWTEWQIVLPLLFVPAIIAEISKWLLGIQMKVARAT